MPKKGAARAGGGAAKKAVDVEKLPAYKQALQLIQQGPCKQAVPMLERALKKPPGEEKRERAKCYIDLADCYNTLKELSQMLMAATAATQEDRTYGAAWLSRGGAHHNLEQHARRWPALSRRWSLVG